MKRGYIVEPRSAHQGKTILEQMTMTTKHLGSIPELVKDAAIACEEYRRILAARDLDNPGLPALFPRMGCKSDVLLDDLKALDEARALLKKIRTPEQIHRDCIKSNLLGKEVADEYRRNALMVRELEILKSMHPRVFPAAA